MNQPLRKTLFWLACLLFAALLQACGNSTVYDEPVRQAGMIYIGDGLKAATVSAYAGIGKEPANPIGTASANENGVFVLDVNQGAYLLEAKLTLQGSGETVVLRADVEAGATARLVYVNAATTLASAVLRKNPQMTLAQAQAAVRRFLALPDNADLAGAYSLETAAFSHKRVLMEAQGAGGVNKLIDRLASELTNSAAATHAFPPPPVVRGAGTDLTLFAAKELAKGMLGKAGGEAMGKILSFAGMDSNADAQILAELAALKTLLGDVKNQLTVVESKMADISQAVTQTDYDVLTTKGDDLLGSIKATTDRLYVLASLTPQAYRDNKAYWDEERDRVNENLAKDLFRYDGKYLDLLKRVLLGGTGNQGIVKVYAKVKSANTRFVGGAEQNDYFDVINAWRYAHIQLFGLRGAYMDYRKAPLSEREAAVAEFEAQFNAIAAAMPQKFPDGVLLDHTNRLMIMDGDYPKMMVGSDNKTFRVINDSRGRHWVTDRNGNPTCEAWSIVYPELYNAYMIPLEPTVFDYVDNVNSRGFSGFSDWRLPSQQDASRMFAGHTGPAWQWAAANGWKSLPASATIALSEPLVPSTCGAPMLTLDEQLTASAQRYHLARALAVPVRTIPAAEYATYFPSRNAY